MNLVDLVKSFPTNIYLQNLASMQKRTSPIKFAHLAEKSENGSISNLPTKVSIPGERNFPQPALSAVVNEAMGQLDFNFVRLKSLFAGMH